MTSEIAALAPLAEEAASLLKSLAHPARLMICCQLRDREMSVGEIETTLGIKQPRLSRELAKLREDGLLETRRESKVVFYRLAEAPRVERLLDSICAVMLGKAEIHIAPLTDAPRPRRAKSGYSVFARPRK